MDVKKTLIFLLVIIILPISFATVQVSRNIDNQNPSAGEKIMVTINIEISGIHRLVAYQDFSPFPEPNGTAHPFALGSSEDLESFVNTYELIIPSNANGKYYFDGYFASTSSPGEEIIKQEITGDDYIDVTPGGISDTDNDGIMDDVDNCMDISNPNQADCDADGIGDICNDGCSAPPPPAPDGGDDVIDSDGDGWLDNGDNCPDNSNPKQEDCDNDNIGDKCDDACPIIVIDGDNDGIPDVEDLCPKEAGLIYQVGSVNILFQTGMKGCPPDCKANDEMSMTCADGSSIITYKCVNYKYASTGAICPKVDDKPPIIDKPITFNKYLIGIIIGIAIITVAILYTKGRR